jgi:hypothetical protein
LWGAGGVGRSPLPALLLNATRVETGTRLVVSPIMVDATSFAEAGDALSAVTAGRGQDLPLVTAAHLSARFPYISPAGRFRGGHVVDGGYFENSGAATALDVLAGLGDAAFADVEPVVVRITNSFPPSPHGAGTREDRWANDLLAPPRTLLRTRDARGVNSARELDRAVRLRHPPGCAITVALGGQEAVNPPLSWVLSRATRRALDAQLALAEPILEQIRVALAGGPCP